MTKYPTAYRKESEGYGRPGLSKGFVGPAPVIAPPPPPVVAPPPPPVPVVPPVPGWALGPAAGVVGGLALGLDVRADIKRFEKNSVFVGENWGPWTEIDVYWGSQSLILDPNDPAVYNGWGVDSFDWAPPVHQWFHYEFRDCAPVVQGLWHTKTAVLGDASCIPGEDFVNVSGGQPAHYEPYFDDGANVAGWTFLPDTTRYRHAHTWDGTPDTVPNELLPARTVPRVPLTDGALGWGTALKVRTAFPEEFPIKRFATVPAPNTWADAVAQPGTQPVGPDGKVPGRLRPLHHPIPLLPLPVVVLPTLPGGLVPVPDTVVVEPAPAPDPGEGGGPPIISRPGNPQNARPGKRTKERKVNVRTVGGKVWAAFNLFTEGLDFLDVLWKAIDPDKRSKQWSRNADGSWNRLDWNDKLRDLYDHWDEIDVATAFANFVNNQVEDMFYGQLGRAGGRATNRLGVHFGLNTALRRAQRGTDVAIELPTLNYDRDSGQFSLDWNGHSTGPLGSPERPGELGGIFGYNDRY